MPKPDLSKETIKKLRAVQACILAEPELYNQCEMPWPNHSCTSPCCIAGWAVWVNNPDPVAYLKVLRSAGGIGPEEMSRTLGITEGQADLLFSEWPIKFEKAWEKPGTLTAAKAGAARIEHFIQTGK
jgi:hypothetical protein